MTGGAGGTGGGFTGGGGTGFGGGGAGSLGGSGGTGGLDGGGAGGLGGSGGLGGTAGDGAGGAAGGGGTGPTTTVTFAQVGQVLNATCTSGPNCHGNGGFGTQPIKFTNADLPTLYQTLTGGTKAEECQNKPLVTPGDPSNSAIVAAVKRECGSMFAMPPTCGPQQNPCIPQTDLDLIVDWIQGGAPGPQ